STLILMLATFGILFCVEKLWRTGVLLIVLLAAVLSGSGLLLFANKLPLSVQRTVSFLPIRVDPVARGSAESSNEWRLEMWKRLLPDVPKYLIKGKGYALDANELYLISQVGPRSAIAAGEGAIFTGDYHNGPLSVLIPFGLFGMAAFLWFLFRSTALLYHNYRFGDPALARINGLLLALFLARIFSFFVIFGSLYADMCLFTGLLGLSISLNGRVAPAAEPEPLLSLQNDLVFPRERV